MELDELKHKASDILEKINAQIDDVNKKGTLKDDPPKDKRTPVDPDDAKTKANPVQTPTAPAIVNSDVRKASRPYSFIKLAKALATHDWSDATVELEMHRWMKRKGMCDDATGILVPIGSSFLPDEDFTDEERAQVKDVMTRGCMHKTTMSLARAKALSEGTDTAGGYLVQPQQSAEFVDLIRANMVVAQAGAREMPLPRSGQLTIPRLTGAATAYWVGEASSITESSETFGDLLLIAKKCAGLVKVSNELIADSSPAAEAIVREDLAQVIGLAEDLAYMQGSGTSTEPRGIVNHSGVTLVSLGTNGLSPTFDSLSTLIGAVEVNNATDLKIITHPKLKHTFREIKGTSNQYVYVDPGAPGYSQDLPTYWGIPVYYSSQLPTTLTKGGSGAKCTRIICGMMSEAVIGRKAVVEVSTTSSGDTAFTADQTWFKAVSRVDFGLRTENVFAHIADAITS